MSRGKFLSLKSRASVKNSVILDMQRILDLSDTVAIAQIGKSLHRQSAANAVRWELMRFYKLRGALAGSMGSLL